MLKWFSYEHLPEALAKISKPFHDLAVKMDEELEEGREKIAMMRKLLEAKDCAVRAYVEGKGKA